MNENKISFTDNFFNIKLYLHALKRLRVTGLITLICLSLLSLITVLSENLGRVRYSFIEAHSGIYTLLALVVFVMVPVMTLIIFHYLTTRNGSDFYHSVASKRRSVYFSFVAAVVTWAFIVIVCFTLITTVAYMLVSDFCIVNAGNIFAYTFNIFVACILVAAIFALGCSITGTLFSNLAASVCILLLPRVIITALAYMVASESLILSTNGMALLTRYTCNLPVAMLFDGSLYTNISFGYTTANVMSFVGFSALYSIILAVIYMLAGCFMYVKRPSETAGKAASSKKIQYCLRMLMGYIVTLLIVFFIYPEVDEIFFMDGEMIFAMIIIFFIAVLLMFLYELISTKSIKSACKSLLHSPILLALDAITIAILMFAGSYTLNNVPDADDVDYIKIDINNLYDINLLLDSFADSHTSIVDEETWNDSYSSYYSYEAYYYNDAGLEYIFDRLSDIELTDSEIIEVATSALSEYTRLIREDNEAVRTRCISNEDGSVTYLPYELCITYGTGASEITRYVALTTADADAIIDTLLSSREAHDILSSLPEYDDADTYVLLPTLSDEEVANIYNTFIEEISTVSLADYLTSISCSHAVCTLDLYNYDNGSLSSTQLYLTTATPKAFGMYMNYYNAHNKASFNNMLTTLINDREHYFAYTAAYVYDYTEGIAKYSMDSGHSSKDLFEVIRTISNVVAAPITDNFAESFAPERYYVCYIYFDYFELYEEEYYSDGVPDTITYESYRGTNGCYFLLSKDYDINKLFDEFEEATAQKWIYVP